MISSEVKLLERCPMPILLEDLGLNLVARTQVFSMDQLLLSRMI